MRLQRRWRAWLTGHVGDRWLNDEMSDIHAVRQGLISITPLQTDTTHHTAVGALRSWEGILK